MSPIVLGSRRLLRLFEFVLIERSICSTFLQVKYVNTYDRWAYDDPLEYPYNVRASIPGASRLSISVLIDYSMIKLDIKRPSW